MGWQHEEMTDEEFRKLVIRDHSADAIRRDLDERAKERDRWLKQHGFTNGLWRLEEAAKAKRDRATRKR